MRLNFVTHLIIWQLTNEKHLEEYDLKKIENNDFQVSLLMEGGPNMPAITILLGFTSACNLSFEGDHICPQSDSDRMNGQTIGRSPL